MAAPQYTVVIQWSGEDQVYVASLPEWGPYCKAYGNSYEEAARQAQEVLELLIEPAPGGPTQLPAPKLFHYPGADIVDMPGPVKPDAQDSSRPRQIA
jgi:antitoxin HicB